MLPALLSNCLAYNVFSPSFLSLLSLPWNPHPEPPPPLHLLVSSPSKMRFLTALVASICFSSLTYASPYRPDLTSYNLNVNQSAQYPTDYSTTRSNTTYTPSPQNWRSIPFYTILMDKFADGDPSNNQFFGSPYEWDWRETQLRFGGDLKGLLTKLDYIQGMGMKGIYLSGTIFINMIWQADSMSISPSLLSLSPIFSQVILLLTSPSWILTGGLSMTG